MFVFWKDATCRFWSVPNLRWQPNLPCCHGVDRFMSSVMDNKRFVKQLEWVTCSALKRFCFFFLKLNLSCATHSLPQFIKVQIRQDLALDVSAAPGDATLSALPAQAATPLLSATRQSTKSSLVSPQTPPATPALVEVTNKTVFFPPTVSGHASGKMRWSPLHSLHMWSDPLPKNVHSNTNA